VLPYPQDVPTRVPQRLCVARRNGGSSKSTVAGPPGIRRALAEERLPRGKVDLEVALPILAHWYEYGCRHHTEAFAEPSLTLQLVHLLQAFLRGKGVTLSKEHLRVEAGIGIPPGETKRRTQPFWT
jgi:hypothetical protein